MNNTNSKIKDVPDIPQELFRSARDGRLVLFIGAGVSRIIGCPSWQRLSITLAKKLWEDRKIDFYTYKRLEALEARKILTICKKLYEENKISFSDTIKSLLNGDKEKIQKFGEIYAYLYNFNAIYITTNYDTFLYKEAQKSKPEAKVIYTKDELLKIYLDSGNIIHLHGSVEQPKSMVITINDYMRFYQDEKVKYFLDGVFSEHTVLFVGYGLEEYEVLEFMIKSSGNSENKTGREIKHFMLYPMFDNEIDFLPFLEKYYGELNISLLPYSIKYGYEYLTEIIKRWNKEIRDVAMSKGFLEKLRLIDEVIK